MKKGYNTPTISSVSKSSQDPVTLRNKIQKLSSAVNELRHNVIQEDTYLETLQQSNMKNYNQLTQQIQILKKSFTSLSDILLNEITSMSDNFGVAVSHLGSKVEQLSTTIQNHAGTTQVLTANYHELEQSLQNIVRANQGLDHQQQELLERQNRVAAQLENEKEDQKHMFEKLKLILQNNQNQIDTINKDKSNHSQQLVEIKGRLQGFVNNFTTLEKRILDQDENLKITLLDVNTRMNELKTQGFAFKEQQRSETITTIRELSQIVRNIEDRLRNQDEIFEQSQKQVKQKLVEYETKQNQQSQEFQQDLQELAQIYKESSSQIINDFDRAVNTQHGELKYLVKKVEILETKYLQLSEDVQIKIKWREKQP